MLVEENYQLHLEMFTRVSRCLFMYTTYVMTYHQGVDLSLESHIHVKLLAVDQISSM